MLESRLHPTPATIPIVMNIHPFYDTLKLPAGHGPDSATVDAILQWGRRWWPSEQRRGRSLSLRWITDESAAFIPLPRAQRDKQLGLLAPEIEHAETWYLNKGHYLSSELIETDAALRKRLRGGSSTAAAGGPVQLYLVAPARAAYWDRGHGVEGERLRYMLDHFREKVRRHEDDSILTRMAALYEPAFAYAENALRGLQDIPLNNSEGRTREHALGNTTSVDEVAVRVEVGENDSDMVDGGLFMAQLRDAFSGLGVGRSAGDTHEKEDTHATAALEKVLQLLFDDPTLTVKVNSWVEIEAKCPTPYCIPALYVLGRHWPGAPAHDAEGATSMCGVREGMLAYRDTIAKEERAPIRDATCCPCLVIGIAGTTIQIFAVYFTDWIHRTHLCDFELDAGDPADEDHDIAIAAKVRIIRNTARMLREAYAKVHTGGSLKPLEHPCRPHLLPRPPIVMPTPLPFKHLYLLDRVNGASAYSELFTGVLKLPGPTDCNDDHDHDDRPESEVCASESASTFASAREVPIHVKFVEKYGIEAHRLLAEHRITADGAPWPLAPQLYWAGEIVAGLLMIVMETLPGNARTLYQHLNPNPNLDSDYSDGAGPDSEPVTWGELGDVRTAVRLLHAHGFVHGDICDVNVMLQRVRPRRHRSTASDAGSGAEVVSTGGRDGGGAETPRAYLIDFDWAGSEGEVRYPADLNTDILWPCPASEIEGQLITKDDDMFMLERLLPQVSLSPESGREPGLERGDNFLNVEKCKRKRDWRDTSNLKRKHRWQEDTFNKET